MALHDEQPHNLLDNDDDGDEAIVPHPFVVSGPPRPPLPASHTVISLPGPEATSHRWNALTTHINRWYYKFDIQALEIVLSAVAAHYTEFDPCWLFIVGPSGSGKGMVINTLMGLANTWLMGDLTTKTFLSGYKSDVNASFLNQVGKSGILLFKDFTTILAKDSKERGEIASQLREIYDGAFGKRTGVGSEPIWHGKITCVAATTPAIEYYWALHREMGDRFVQVRWPRVDGVEAAMAASRQLGMEGVINSTARKMAAEFFMGYPVISPPPELPSDMSRKIANMSELAALARASVMRGGQRQEIMDVPQPELSTRIPKAVATVMRFHSSIFRKPEVTPEGIAAGKRIALDSIPTPRLRIIKVIPKDGSGITPAKIMGMTGINLATYKWNIDELEALGIIERTSARLPGQESQVKLTERVVQLWQEGYA